MSTSHRVVVTGLGVVSALGSDCNSFWTKLAAGQHGFKSIELADTQDLQFHEGGEISDYDPHQHFDPSTLGLLDRNAQFWILAARQAIAQSGLSKEELRDAAIVNGCSLGGQTTQDDLFKQLYKEGRRRVTPFAVPRIMSNSGASQLSMEMGIEGPAFTLSTACSSSNHAIGLAFNMLGHGSVERAIVGGNEAPFSRGHLKAWDGIRAVSPELCRPFSLGRRGLVLGEGAGAMTIETLETARKRDAIILGEIVGFGMSADAGHVTKPSADGAARAIAAALRSAELNPTDIDYVNAHGTGTPLNDAVETVALRKVFGEHADRLPVSSTKSMHGHALGAAGGLEAVATVLALQKGVIPPTANFVEVDPECALDVVPNEARESRARFAISDSFAFGGLNAVLAFERWDGDS